MHHLIAPSARTGSKVNQNTSFWCSARCDRRWAEVSSRQVASSLFQSFLKNRPTSSSTRAVSPRYGTFTLVIEELPGPINAVLEASALSHYMQNRVLAIQAGQSYDGQDFQLQATS